MPPTKNHWYFGAALAVLLLAIFTGLRLLQAILLAPVFLSSFAFFVLAGLVYYAIRSDRESQPSPASRQRRAIRPLRFTQSAAWAATLDGNPTDSTHPPIRPNASPELNNIWNRFLGLIIQHFVLPWYDRISPSPAFPYAVDGVIRDAVQEVIHRAEAVDWPIVMVSKVLPVLTNHLQHYRSVEHHTTTSPLLPLPLPPRPHKAFSDPHLSSSAIEEHLRQTLTRIISQAVPEKDQTPVVVTIVREILLGAVVTPMLTMICEADFWNRQIDEHVGKYLHEQQQVDKFLSALSSLPASKSSTIFAPSLTRKNRNPASINADSTTSQFDVFLKSIRKLKSLGEARRLRADVERELRVAKVAFTEDARKVAAGDGPKGKDGDKETRRNRKYVERLEKARMDIDTRIDMLSGDSKQQNHSKTVSIEDHSDGHVTLYTILLDPSSLAYWLEHMERRQRSRLVQYWLTVEGFKDPLEVAGIDGPSPDRLSADDTVHEDVKFLYSTYFADPSSAVIEISPRYKEIIEHGALVDKLDASEITKIKRAIFSSQKEVYEQMEEEDWNTFRKGELFRKAVGDLQRSGLFTKSMSEEKHASRQVSIDNPEPYTIPSSHHTPGPKPPRKRQTIPETSKSLLNLLPRTSNTGLASPLPGASPETSSRKCNLAPPPPLLSAAAAPPSAPSLHLTEVRVASPPPFLRSYSDSTQKLSDQKLVGTNVTGRKGSAGDVEHLQSQLQHQLSLPYSPSSPQSPSPHHTPRLLESPRLLSPAMTSAPLDAPPPTARRSSQLDFLINSAGEEPERSKLFGDDDYDDGENEETRRMEAIQTALSEIIADDAGDAETQQTRDGKRSALESPADVNEKDMWSSMILPENSAKENKIRKTRSAEDMRNRSSPLSPKVPRVVLSSERHQPRRRESTLLFDDTLPEDDEVSISPSNDDEGSSDLFDSSIIPTPGDLQLSSTIARLGASLTELAEQSTLLESLIGQAELTGNQKELKILRRSHTSVRREIRAKEWQKREFIRQEEENRLVPGRTRLDIPSAVVCDDADGAANSAVGLGAKQVVRYTVRVSQVSHGQTIPGWVVTRRYNEFWEMDKSLREWASARGEIGVIDTLKRVEIPGKRIVGLGSISSGFVESRRAALEKYLQGLLASSSICDSYIFRAFISLTPSVPNGSSSLFNGPLSSLAPLAPHNVLKSLYKTISPGGAFDDFNDATGVTDFMYSGLSRQINDIGGMVGLGLGYPSSTNSDAESVAGAPLGEGMTSFTAPICDLFIEMFDLTEKEWLRRQAIVIILQQFLGGTIERKVREALRLVTSPSSLGKSLSALQDALFPSGLRRPPATPRTEEEKSETRSKAGKKLGLVIPELVANMMGRGNARRAARRVFGTLQDERMNQHLVLCVMDVSRDVEADLDGHSNRLSAHPAALVAHNRRISTKMEQRAFYDPMVDWVNEGADGDWSPSHPSDAQRESILYLCLFLVIILIFWQGKIAYWWDKKRFRVIATGEIKEKRVWRTIPVPILWPFKILTVLYHELSHAIVGMCTIWWKQWRRGVPQGYTKGYILFIMVDKYEGGLTAFGGDIEPNYTLTLPAVAAAYWVAGFYLLDVLEPFHVGISSMSLNRSKFGALSLICLTVLAVIICMLVRAKSAITHHWHHMRAWFLRWIFCNPGKAKSEDEKHEYARETRNQEADYRHEQDPEGPTEHDLHASQDIIIACSVFVDILLWAAWNWDDSIYLRLVMLFMGLMSALYAVWDIALDGIKYAKVAQSDATLMAQAYNKKTEKHNNKHPNHPRAMRGTTFYASLWLMAKLVVIVAVLVGAYFCFRLTKVEQAIESREFLPAQFHYGPANLESDISGVSDAVSGEVSSWVAS
ncbi:hypothetical protein I350_00546 [Cryptococcus amylolentus CBS 6273]|uniref:PXA domain-containing protein n=1 Tax=Cryptococcus amylolentus CBS 6273 TaxID=1296118 RepID=A0A1E3KHH2_9TREE|nr:hypothetical protein I350_00546 [Cryptococcus amylolentus CBS 6273]